MPNVPMNIRNMNANGVMACAMTLVVTAFPVWASTSLIGTRRRSQAILVGSISDSCSRTAATALLIRSSSSRPISSCLSLRARTQPPSASTASAARIR